MKKLLFILMICIAGCISEVSAQTYVSGYFRQDGTYVDGYYRSERNNTNLDNFSTLGNYNPYTGSIGSIAQDYSIEAYNYGSGQTIYTGPQGGQYYINSNGNKTYVPKRNTSTGNTVGGYNYSEYNISTSNYSWLW